MNKLGIKVYTRNVLYIDNIYYTINSIIYDNLENQKFRMRYIDVNLFGISLKYNKK